MIFIFLILFLAFLLALSWDDYGFNWPIFFAVFLVLSFIFFAVITSHYMNDAETIEKSYFENKMQLEKIITKNREVYLAGLYNANGLVGYTVNTKNGFGFLSTNGNIDIIEDGKNYITFHTKTSGSFWTTLFSKEVIDYYEIHIPQGSIMYKVSN